MSTKEEPGPFDGLERAEPNEPVFTLRAHDVLATPLVHEWVSRRRQAILHSDLPPEKEELELIQCREAEEIAFAMVDYRNGAAAAPMVEEKPAEKYSGHASSAEELAAKHRYDVIKRAVQALNNALAEVTDTAATLEEFGFANERTVILASADRLKAVANHITPKRASYSIMDVPPEPFTHVDPVSIIRDCFLNMIADARRFDEDVDGDTDGEGGTIVTIDYHLTVGHSELGEFCETIGIKPSGFDETLFDAISKAANE